MKKVFRSLNAQNTVGHAALILGFFYLVSAIFGFVRDRFLASTFGAENGLLDAYYAAFRIPDFIFNVLVLGAVSAAFIPVFIEYYYNKKEKEAWQVANIVLNYAVLILGFFGIIVAIFATPILSIFTHGFRDQFATLLTGERVPMIALTASLTRIMLLSSLFFGIASIAGAVQNSLKRFILYAAAPVIYNLSIIFGIVFLAPKFDIYGVAYGVLIGAFLVMLLSMFSIYSLGFRSIFTLQWRHPGFIRIVRLMIFRAGALMADQINLLVEVSVGSALPAGSIAFFTLANNLERLPATLFGISLATAIFPSLAVSISLKNSKDFIKKFSQAARQILFLVLPTSVAFILLRREITALILDAGQFTPLNARITASALGWFSVSLFAQSTMPIITRAFFSIKDTRTPFFVALFTMVTNFIAAVFFSQTLGMGAPGLALAFSTTSILNVGILTILLKRKVGDLDEKVFAKSLVKIFIATGLMGLSVIALRYFLGTDPTLAKSVVLTHSAVLAFVGAGVYFLSAWFLRSPEIKFLRILLVKFKIVQA